MIQEMIDKNYIKGKGLPCKLAHLPGRCSICNTAVATKLSQGLLVNTTELPVGARWHLEFTFFSVMSIRGFAGVLIIVKDTSHCLGFSPCQQKSTPVDLCLFFFSHV